MVCAPVLQTRPLEVTPTEKSVCRYQQLVRGGTGINGAGKTTQLQIITGALQPDSGEIIKEKANMKIAYLTQEFDVKPSRTVRVCRGVHPPPFQWVHAFSAVDLAR